MSGLCATDESLEIDAQARIFRTPPTFIDMANTYHYISVRCTPVSPQFVPLYASKACNRAFQPPFIDCGLNLTCFKRICEYERLESSNPVTAEGQNQAVCLALAEHYRMCALSVEMKVEDYWRSKQGCGNYHKAI